MSFSGRSLPSYLENGHQNRLTESYDADPPVLAVTQLLWGPTRPESFLCEFVTPTASKNTENVNLKSSRSTNSVEGHGDSTNGIETSKSSRSQRSCALADDERSIRWTEELLEEWEGWRASFVFGVIHKLLSEVCDSFSCSNVRALWLRIIEGLVDDDVWLWVDGDEAWHRAKKQGPYGAPTVLLTRSEWADARSALHRRVAEQRYPSMTGSHGSRNERIRNATPDERVCAIAWLIVSSKDVAQLFASHGCTPPTFRTPKIASILTDIIGAYWDAFSSQTSTWKNALATSKEDGCICSPVDFYDVRQWFNMVVWLEGNPPTLELSYKSCVRCRSLLKSRYEDIGAQRTVISHLSLSHVLLDYSSGGHVILKRRLSPTAELLVGRKLEPLMKKHGFDVRYLPWVNRFPEDLRRHIARYGCRSEGPSTIPTVEFPDSVFDAPDPWVVLGIIALAMWGDPAGKDTDLHDEGWHSHFSWQLRRYLDCFDLPVHPSLSATSVKLCHKLDQDYSEQRSFSQFCPARDSRQLPISIAVTVAVATFLWEKAVYFYGCRRCQMFFTSSVTRLKVGNSGEPDGRGPPLLPNDALRGGQYSPFQGSLEVNVQEPAGMEAFTSMLRDPTLSQHEKKSQLGRRLLELSQYADSLGLGMSDRFELHPGESALPRRLPDHGISSSSKPSKPDKVEEIKNKLLDMLKELGLRYNRLPWYTLEKDLEKNGYALINWPTGVDRKRRNKGIHDLSAAGVNKLYEAITCPDETQRLHICRSQSALTVVPVQPVNRTPAAASSSKRPVPEESDFDGSPSKRVRFKDMTSKVSHKI
ncbi:hypothetical protein EDC04DRAFT_892978 [Pisolithus marmoratus]|nr:hypothetical protein EDC04DRAFT_892978 [Pisolithus marmoratus]